MAVLAFADILNGKITKSSFEAASYAARTASAMGTEALAVSYGNLDDAAYEELGNYGISKVMVAKDVESMDPIKLAKAVAEAAQQAEATTIVFSQD